MENFLWADGKEIRKKLDGKGVSVYPVSSKDIENNVMSMRKGGENGERERKESSKVWWYSVKKMFLLSVFYFDIVFVFADKILGVNDLFWKLLLILIVCRIFTVFEFDYGGLEKIEGVFEL